MALGDATQIGKAFKLEYGSFTYTGYQPTSLTNSRGADVETVQDTRGATCTHIVRNKTQVLTLTAYIEDSAGSITPPDVGTEVSVTDPGGTTADFIIITPATISHSNGITTLNVTLQREDSMQATYDA